MGLKKTNYEVKRYGITLPEAYARLTHVNINIDGRADAMFEIQQTREDIGVKRPLETIFFDCEIDKEQPVYKQIYEKAKEEVFAGWEDDIIQNTVDSTSVEVMEENTGTGGEDTVDETGN